MPETDVRLHLGDCLEFLRTLEPGSVDAVITSPPYNIGNVHHRGQKKHTPYPDAMDETEYQGWQVQVLCELHRVAKNCFYNHKNRIRNGRQISPLEWIAKTPWVVKQECVWVNGGPNHDPCRFFPKTERVYWLSQDVSARLNNRRHWDVFNWPTVSVRLDSGQHTRAFPAEYPLTVLEVMPDAMTILDPFMGSGTTGVACVRTGRNFIGCEIDPTYFAIAERRIAAEREKTALFA